MLSLARLRVLSVVAEHGSFSSAALALDYTQSAVSQQIAALERECSCRLVERLPRGVRLTPAGQVLIGHAQGILASVTAAEVELAAIAGLRGGQLRMASFPSAGATLMPLAIGIFRAQHPDVELSLIEAEPNELVTRLGAAELDLALLFDFGVGEPAWPGELESLVLFEDPMFVALPGDHPLATRPRLRLHDLSEEAWVQTSQDSQCAQHVVHSCHAAGFAPRTAFYSDDYQTVQGLVAAGVGVALIPALALTNVREDIAVRSLSTAGLHRRVLAATPVAANRTPATVAMQRILRDVAGRHVRTRSPALR